MLCHFHVKTITDFLTYKLVVVVVLHKREPLQNNSLDKYGKELVCS